ISTLFPYTTLFRSLLERLVGLRRFRHTEARIVEQFGVHLSRLDVALDDQHEWCAGASMLGHQLLGKTGGLKDLPHSAPSNLSRTEDKVSDFDDHKISRLKAYVTA